MIAYSRKPAKDHEQNQAGIEWREMSSLQDNENAEKKSDWVWVAPIKTLPQQLHLLQRAGAHHIVALSSTSRFTKKTSSSAEERIFVEELIAGEDRLQQWAEKNSAETLF